MMTSRDLRTTDSLLCTIIGIFWDKRREFLTGNRELILDHQKAVYRCSLDRSHLVFSTRQDDASNQIVHSISRDLEARS